MWTSRAVASISVLWIVLRKSPCPAPRLVRHALPEERAVTEPEWLSTLAKHSLPGGVPSRLPKYLATPHFHTCSRGPNRPLHATLNEVLIGSFTRTQRLASTQQVHAHLMRDVLAASGVVGTRQCSTRFAYQRRIPSPLKDPRRQQEASGVSTSSSGTAMEVACGQGDLMFLPVLKKWLRHRVRNQY